MMQLRVIGTGFGRTGTDSLRTALNLLGFGPCHHMIEVMHSDDARTLWRTEMAKVERGETPDYAALLHGYNSCVDFPSAMIWPQLVALNPQAKVILTLRSAESWWASFEKTILQGIQRNTEPDALVAVLGRLVFGGHAGNRERAIAAFEANTAKTLATVPADRLLVHRLGDGWEPLCAFLGVPVPDAPYPSGNTVGEFQARVAANANR